LVDIAGDISLANQVSQERDRVSHYGNKNQQKSGIFVVNQTNCYELEQKPGRVKRKAFLGSGSIDSEEGRHAMSVSLRFSVISRLAGAAAVIWMYGAGSAWAGDSGSSGISVYGVFTSIVSMFFPQITSPPVFPTATNDPVTPIILETAALTNLSLDEVRVANTVCAPGGPASSGLPYCSQIAVNAANQPANSLPEVFADTLELLTPLAFISNQGTLLGTQFGDPKANSFLYAYIAASNGGGQPNSAVFVFDYLPGTSKKLVKNQPAASINFQIGVLDTPSSERSVAASLTLTPTCNGAASCLSGTVTGDFVTAGTQKSYTPEQLGMSFSYIFGASPNSATPHTMVQIVAPLLVTAATDPAYFAGAACPTGFNPFSGYCDTFSTDEGYTPPLVGKPIGISPLAALGPVPPTPPNSPPGPPIVASFLGNPAVSTFFAIGTNGVTLVSTPVASSD
jgi:hypothetical protein